jgi:hypothetical protein
MPEHTPAAPAATPATQQPDLAAIRAEAQAAERARIVEIRTIAEQAGMQDAWINEQIAAGTTPDAARAAALADFATRRQAPVPTSQVQITRDEGETRAAALVEAFEHATHVRADLPERAREYRATRYTAFARMSLEAAGHKTRGMDDLQCLRAALARDTFRRNAPAAHTSSDFPNLLANTASKGLLQKYGEAPRTFALWASRRDLPDFKDFREISMDSAPSLRPLAEAETVKYGTIGEGAETWRLMRYSSGFALSYVALVNDDMGGFSDIPSDYGMRAAALESDIVYSTLLANGTLSDGGALFNSTALTAAGGHANLLSGATSKMSFSTADGAAAAIAAVGGLEEMLGKQLIPGTKSPANLRGAFLLVPLALGTAARQLFSADTGPSNASEVNPYRTQYQVITESRLQLGMTIGDTVYSGSSTAFYLMAATGRTVRYGSLQGESSPAVTSELDFDTDGLKIKCTHTFGAKAVDFRSMAKSAGA